MRDNTGLKLVDTAEKGFAAGGVRGMLQNMRDLQKKLYDRGLQSPYALAQTDSLLGNKQEALEYLQHRLRQARRGNQSKSRPTRHSTTCIDDPAYKELIARLGFPAAK